MLIKLLVSVYERARSKLTSTRSNSRISSDSDIETTNFDPNSIKQISSSGPLIIQQQLRSSLSKWLCTTPNLSSKSNKVRRSSSWRSLKERGNNSINSRTHSVDELHRKNYSSRQRDISHSPIISLTHQRRKLSDCNGAIRHTRFDRLSSTLVNYSDKNKHLSRKSQRRKQFEQQIFSTLSRNSGGGDSGYSEESFATRSCRRPLHTSCPHCHCERRSSFNNYKKLRNNSSTESSPSDIITNKEIKLSTDFDYQISQDKQNLLSSQSYPHIKPLPKINIQPQQRITRTLTDKRRRNLSCDSSLWTRTQRQTTLTSSPVLSEPNRLSLQRHFTAIGMTHCHPSTTHLKTLSTNPNVFGELNLAAIELDSLRTSFSSSYSSSSSSSSSSINHEKKSHHQHRKRTFLVWHEYQNSSLLSTTNGTNTFSVIRGDQVRVLKRIGKSTFLVEKEEDGSIGFLPQTCLAHHQINSFLSLKGLRETVL